jgi:hypothetical protein
MPSDHTSTPADRRIEWVLARTLSESTLGYDTVLTTLSHTFDGECAQQLMERLDDASRPLFGIADTGLFDKADGLAEVITNRLGLKVGAPDEWRTLLLGHALAERTAHPLLLAALAHELARRAGTASLVARSHDDFCCVLVEGDAALPVCFGDVPDGLDVSALRQCCPHEVAYTTLTGIALRADGEAAAVARRTAEAMPIDWDLTEWSAPTNL